MNPNPALSLNVGRPARWARWVVWALMPLWPATLIGMNLYGLIVELPRYFSACGPGLMPKMTPTGYTIVGVTLGIYTALIILSLRQIDLLLAELAKGRIFYINTTVFIKRTGIIMIFWWIFPAILDSLSFYALWRIGNFPEYSPAYPTSFELLIIGIFTYIFGNIMQEAVRVSDEQKLTI